MKCCADFYNHNVRCDRIAIAKFLRSNTLLYEAHWFVFVVIISCVWGGGMPCQSPCKDMAGTFEQKFVKESRLIHSTLRAAAAAAADTPVAKSPTLASATAAVSAEGQSGNGMEDTLASANISNGMEDKAKDEAWSTAQATYADVCSTSTSTGSGLQVSCVRECACVCACVCTCVRAGVLVCVCL